MTTGRGVLPRLGKHTAYGVGVTRSDLALAALATAAVPGMKPVSVAGVRPATDQSTPRYQVAFVEDATGRTWVVRAPLDAAGGAELERNDELIRMLGRHLPFKVPAAAGYADLGAAGRAAVYPYVEASALNFRHLPVGPGLTSAVGRALAAVHNIQRELFEEAGTPVFDAAAYRARRLAELDRAAETGHVPTGLLTRWEQALEAAPLWQFSTTATHGSLDGGSFLVAFAEDDAATGRVVALTGWENAQVADPADDFAALVKQASPEVVDAVLESYAIARSQRPDGYLIHRARLASELQLVAGLAHAVDAEDTAVIRERAEKLRKLDRLTSVDDSLVPRTALVATPRSDSTVTTAPEANVSPQPVVQPDAATEADGGSSAGADDHDPDATGPVPPPGEEDVAEGRTEDADGAADVDETDDADPLDGGVVEVSDRPAAWQTVQGRQAEPAEDPTEEIPAPEGTGAPEETVTAEPVTPEEAEAAEDPEVPEDPAEGADAPEDSADATPDLGDDESDEAGEDDADDAADRLQTLYGMPTEPDASATDAEDAAAEDPADDPDGQDGETSADRA